MLASYVLSSTLVPVLSTWMLRQGHEEPRFFDRIRSSYGTRLRTALRFRWVLVGVYFAATTALILLLLPHVGTEIFPRSASRQLQLRLRAPTGTRVERTELIALKAMDVIKDLVGPNNVEITTGFIGVQPPTYPINTIYLFTSGQHEAVLRVALKPSAAVVTDELKEALRHRLKETLPNVTVSFEAADIISQVMSFGSPTPIEVAVQGPSLAVSRPFAEKVFARAEQGGVAARLAVRAAAGLSVAANPDRSGSRGAIWRHRSGRGEVTRGCHVVEPVHRSELLARSGKRQRVSDSGRNSPVQDGVHR